MNAVKMIAKILVIVGGLNWGLVGAANFNLVETILGTGTIAKLVYILVGLSALWMLLPQKKANAAM